MDIIYTVTHFTSSWTLALAGNFNVLGLQQLALDPTLVAGHKLNPMSVCGLVACGVPFAL